VLIDAVFGGIHYLRSNPLFLFRAARNAARLELSMPIDLLRWAIERRPRGKGPERIELSAEDPALGVGLTVDLYGTKIDVAAKITVEAIDNGADELSIALRVRDLSVKAPPGSPAAMMVQSLDLAHPGNLIGMMPQKHAGLIDAHDDRFVLNLMKLPSLAKNRRLRRILGALSFIGVREIRTDGDLLVIGLSVNPLHLPAALQRVRGA
jgi:hypothetical protein